MVTSEAINELAAALAKAQLVMVTASKDSTNPHFRSKYADLASVREACRPLAEHGIATIQGCRTVVEDGATYAEVETRFLHTSGQWMADTLRVPVAKVDAQGCASAMTYARRIGLAGLSGIAPADDDGESAVGRGSTPVSAPATKPAGFDDWWSDIQSAADMGSAALKSAWEQSSKELRAHVSSAMPSAWAATKARAERVVSA